MIGLVWIHGIHTRTTTHSKGARGLERRLETLSMDRFERRGSKNVRVVPASVGFIWAWNPMNAERRMRDAEKYRQAIRSALADLGRISEISEIAILAHSYGTYNLGRIAQREQLKSIHPKGSLVSRVLLFGSILNRRFNWRRVFHKNVYMYGVWNIAKPLDMIVWLSSLGRHWYGAGTGYSGLLGFHAALGVFNHFVRSSGVPRHAIGKEDHQTILRILTKTRLRLRGWEEFRRSLSVSERTALSLFFLRCQIPEYE